MLHFSSEAWHAEHSRAEQYRSIEVDQRQGISFTEPVLLAQGCRKGQSPPPLGLASSRPYPKSVQDFRVSARMGQVPETGEGWVNASPPSSIRRVDLLGFSGHGPQNR